MRINRWKNIFYVITIIVVIFLAITLLHSCRNVFSRNVDIQSMFGSKYYNTAQTSYVIIYEDKIIQVRDSLENEHPYRYEDNYLIYEDDSKDNLYIINEEKIFDYTNREYLYRSTDNE